MPDEVRRPGQRWDEIVRSLRRLVVGERRLAQVGASLGGRVDDGAVDRVQRALRERRVRAHRLDLVTEELEAERLAAGGREHIDDPAADGELAALLGALDALVARERKPLREVFLGVLGEPKRLGPLVRRRKALGDRGRRGGDETAGGEDVERTGPLADEVRGRLEPGAPADAAARQERDHVVAEEPGSGLGRVTRVGILRKDDHEPSIELEMESREEERQRRLGDPSARPLAVCGLYGEADMRFRDLFCERLETLAVGELLRNDV